MYSVPALGRTGHRLGDLYDLQTHTFWSGQNLLTCSAEKLCHFTHSASSSNTRASYLVGDSYENKCKTFDVNGELKLGVLADLFGVEGSVKFLRHRKSSNTSKSGSLLYKIRTVKESLNLFNAELKDERYLTLENVQKVLKLRPNMHVVTEIQYGANVIVCFESRDEEKVKSTSGGGGLKAGLPEIPFISPADGSGSGEVDVSKLSGKELGNFESHVFGDFMSNEKIPGNCVEAVKYMQNVPEKVCPKGVALRYGLLPLGIVSTVLGEPMTLDAQLARIDESTIQDMIRLFEEVEGQNQTIADLERLVEEFSFVVMEEDRAKLIKCKNQLKDFETSLKMKVREGLQAARSSDSDSSGSAMAIPTIEELQSEFSTAKGSPRSNRARVEALKAILLHSVSFARLLLQEGASFITQNNPLEHQLHKHQDTDLYLLSTNGEHRGIGSGAGARDWNLNKRVFIGLCRDAKAVEGGDGAKPIFYVQATSSRLEDDSIISFAQISRYKNGIRLGQNLASTANRYPVAKATGALQSWVHKPPQKKVIKLPCPKGPCGRDKHYWHCAACKKPLEYGLRDAHFYCDCGYGPASSFSYHCGDFEKHGLVFGEFAETQWRELLTGIRSGPETNLLVLGETGVGKSTWINGLVHYLTYTTLKEAAEGEDVSLIPTQFWQANEGGQLVEIRSGPESENERVESGKSATKYPKSYLFAYGEEDMIQIIDTPGVGDTEGIEQDETNFANILHHISHMDDLHGICILLHPQLSRESVTFRFCITELLKQLPKNAAENIVFCYTHASNTKYMAGNTARTLTKFLKDAELQTLIPVTTDTTYFLENNSVRFLAARRNKWPSTEEEERAHEESWAKCYEQTSRLIRHVRERPPHFTDDTISLNKVRALLLVVTVPIADITKLLEDNIALAEGYERELEAAERERRQGRESPVPRTSIPMEKLVAELRPYPKIKCYNSTCPKLKEDAEGGEGQSHQIADEPLEPRGCFPSFIRKPKAPCKYCGCDWKKHRPSSYLLTQVPDRKELSPVLHESGRTMEILVETRAYTDKLKEEKETLLDSVSQFGAFLAHNAFTPYNDTLPEYIEYLIRIEEGKPRVEGDEMRERKLRETKVERLKGMLESYKKKVESLKDAIKAKHARVLEMAEVKERMKVLYELVSVGKKLMELVEMEQAAQIRDMVFNQQTYVPKRFFKETP